MNKFNGTMEFCKLAATAAVELVTLSYRDVRQTYRDFRTGFKDWNYVEGPNPPREAVHWTIRNELAKNIMPVCYAMIGSFTPLLGSVDSPEYQRYAANPSVQATIQYYAHNYAQNVTHHPVILLNGAAFLWGITCLFAMKQFGAYRRNGNIAHAFPRTTRRNKMRKMERELSAMGLS